MSGAYTRTVAPYATQAQASAGRVHAEPACPMRTPFQRDRDRIVHATAFRRLTYKTQVFVFHEGDHYRTRLTHSLEVAQIARAIARMLALDEDLAEALALAHDLGHPPFGHAGERALAQVMAGYGGFDHNAQSFKVVTRLERKYAAFDGLNLTLETLEGLAKHNGPLAPEGLRPATCCVRRSMRPACLPAACTWSCMRRPRRKWRPSPTMSPTTATISTTACGRASSPSTIFSTFRLPGGSCARRRAGSIDKQRTIYEVNRRIITTMIDDVVRESRARLSALREQSLQGVREAGRPVIAASEQRRAEIEGLQAICSPMSTGTPASCAWWKAPRRSCATCSRATWRSPARCRTPGAPPPSRRGAQADRATVVSDFVAGMTDRFAINEHRRLFDATPELR